MALGDAATSARPVRSATVGRRPPPTTSRPTPAAGDVDDVLAAIDEFAYEKSMLINVGDEKGELLDAAVRRARPASRWSSAPTAATARCASPAPPRRRKVFSRRVRRGERRGRPAHLGARRRRRPGHLRRRAPSATAARPSTRSRPNTASPPARSTSLFIDHDKSAYLADLQASSTAAGCTRLDRRRRQRQHPRRAEVPRLHARAAGQAVEHRRARDSRRVPDAVRTWCSSRTTCG